MDFTSAKLTDVVKLDGVKDLTLAVRAPFAKAILAEARGEFVKASESLQKALEAEAKVRAESA